MKTLQLTDEEAKIVIDRLIFGPSDFSESPEIEAVIDRVLAGLGYVYGGGVS